MYIFLKNMIAVSIILTSTNLCANETTNSELTNAIVQSKEETQTPQGNNPAEDFTNENLSQNALKVKEASTEAVDFKNTSAIGQTAELNVVDFVLTNKIEGREPQQVVEIFETGSERGYAFARLNVKKDSDVTFVWYRNDSEYSRVKMPVHTAQKWRTYASVKLRPGNWKVQLVSNQEEVLAEKSFLVE